MISPPLFQLISSNVFFPNIVLVIFSSSSVALTKQKDDGTDTRFDRKAFDMMD